ncbi:AMP-binding protein [Prochlorococcus sp. MIT 1307]|uniref:AMP-binding protein n=1 Tax=Prochlorococcus sp. MIT 1307 TaxID=3096219 RepID=UPI002A763926|nr:AMP-binding protein [Prochlorococcus sp. MIT 1307]
MNFLNRITNQGVPATGFARSSWNPTQQELDALAHHDYVQGIDRVDQIWEWLSKKHGEIIAVDAPHCTIPETFTYSEIAELIAQVASGFESFGVTSGDVVALFSENSPRWLIADQALMRLGAADAVRGAFAPIDELRYILSDSSSVAIVVQNAELWRNLDLNLEQRNRLKLVVQLEGEPTDDFVVSWEALVGAGIAMKEVHLKTVRKLDSATSPIATILYTSGTTGKPKGVPLSHANLLHQIRSLACIANPPAGSPVLSVLPIWHSYERSAEYYFFSCACTQNYTTIKKLKQDLPRVRPVVMATVPRLWEAVQIGFDDAVKKMSPIKQRLLKASLANSGAYKLALRTFRELLIDEVSIRARIRALVEMIFRWPMHAMASSLLWPKILAVLSGGKLVFPINGGGAIAPHVDLFFEALGVELLVGYGLTETSPVVSCRRPWRNVRGSSGTPLPETEFRIVDIETGALKMTRERGRVLVRGPQVMNGYLGKPEATAKVLDPEGWLDTGDLGMLLPDGSLVLTGRAKDTIVLSNGENIEPSPLEEALVSSPLLEQVMLVGQDERQLGALVVPNIERTLFWAEQKKLAISKDLGGSPGDETLRKLIRSELNRLLAQRQGSRPDERLAGVAFVKPFSIENGLLTQTLKQKREKIVARDFEAIASIYGR